MQKPVILPELHVKLLLILQIGDQGVRSSVHSGLQTGTLSAQEEAGSHLVQGVALVVLRQLGGGLGLKS